MNLGVVSHMEGAVSVSSPPPAGVGSEATATTSAPGSSQPLYQENVLQEPPGGRGLCRRPPPPGARTCGREITGAQQRTCKPASTPAGRPTGAPSCVTISPDTPKGSVPARQRRAGDGGGPGRRPPEGPSTLGYCGAQASWGGPRLPCPPTPAMPT